MRRGIGILAICGTVALAAGAGLGDDQNGAGVDQSAQEASAYRRSKYFSPGKRPANPGSQAAAGAKPGAQAPMIPSSSRIVDSRYGAFAPDRKELAEPAFFPSSDLAAQDSAAVGGIPPATGASIPRPFPVVPAQNETTADAMLIRAGLKPQTSSNPQDLAGEAWSDAPARPALDRRPADSQQSGGFDIIRADAVTGGAPAEPIPRFSPAPLPSPQAAAIHADATRTNAGDVLLSGKSDAPALLSRPIVAGSQTATVTVEWTKQSDIVVGQECECRLVVKNSGEAPAREVSVDVQFPSTVRLIAALPRPAAAKDRLTWTFPELAPGAAESIGVRLVPSERGELAAMASVRFTSAAPGRFQVDEPMLELTVKGPKEVMMGDPASQTILVSNPGTGVASNVRIESQIPPGLEHPRGDRLVMEVGSLNPGETRAIRLALSAVEGGQHNVQISARAGASLVQNATAEINVIAPNVKLTLEGPGLRFIGRSAKYTLTVVNDGAAPTNNVRVLHRVPDGFQFVSADNGGKFDPSSMTASWFVGRLEPQQTAQLTVELLPVLVGSHVHKAGVVTEHGSKAGAELATEVDGTASLVLEIVDRNDPVEVGVETGYEVRIRNEGSKAARNVALACEVPEGVQLIGTRGPTDAVVEKGVVVFKNLEQLEPGKTATYLLQVKGRIEGNHRLRARLASDSIQEPLLYEELTKFYGG
jgi:uncharacterized repeat protein (TIGR01451 family)